jgi:hypothetical protein
LNDLESNNARVNLFFFHDNKQSDKEIEPSFIQESIPKVTFLLDILLLQLFTDKKELAGLVYYEVLEQDQSVTSLGSDK